MGYLYCQLVTGFIAELENAREPLVEPGGEEVLKLYGLNSDAITTAVVRRFPPGPAPRHQMYDGCWTC